MEEEIIAKDSKLIPIGFVIFWLFLVAIILTWGVWSGDLLGTLSADDNYYYDDASYGLHGISYEIKYWMGMVISSVDGFFVNTDITFTIADGYIEFTGDNVPKNENITVVIKFEPPPRIDGEFIRQSEHIKTKFNGKTRYKFSSSPMVISYPVSEPKHLQPVVFVNGTIVAGSLNQTTFLDVEPAYMKTQLNLSKAVVILTIWIIVLSIIIMIFGIVKMSNKKSPSNYDKGNRNDKSHSSLNLPIITGITISIIGVLLVICGLLIKVDSYVELGKWIVPLGIGTLSVGLAINAIEISKNSHEKMKELSNMSFLEALNDFEYTRIRVLNPPKYTIGTFIWRSLSDCERIAELNRCHIRSRNQQKFVSYFCASMEALYKEDYYNLKWNDLEGGGRNQIVNMYVIVRKYEKKPNEENRLKVIREKFMGQKKGESESDFYNRMVREYKLDDYDYK